MKQSIPPGAVIAAIVVVVLIIGFVAYRNLFPNPNVSPDSAVAKQQYDAARSNSAILKRMQNESGGQPGSAIQQGGQGPRGAYTHGMGGQ